MKRRTFLKGSMAGTALAVAAGAGLLQPSRVMAAAWPEAAFKQKKVDGAIKAYFGTSDAAKSGDIKIKAPLQAENGAVVPIKINTSLASPESIAVVVEKNPAPFATSVDLNGAGGFFSARIKMGTTSKVSAYVKSGGKVHVASQVIKVTVGGCGG